jgi:hypothetical protein
MIGSGFLQKAQGAHLVIALASRRRRRQTGNGSVPGFVVSLLSSPPHTYHHCRSNIIGPAGFPVAGICCRPAPPTISVSCRAAVEFLDEAGSAFQHLKWRSELGALRMALFALHHSMTPSLHRSALCSSRFASLHLGVNKSVSIREVRVSFLLSQFQYLFSCLSQFA